MRKLRSDALWHKLTPDQQARIEHWLFVEKFSLAKTHALMRTELGIQCALSIIGPMYHYLNELRSHERETILQKLTEVITEPGTNLNLIRTDSLTVITNHLMQRCVDNGDIREIAALGRVMVQGEERDIQRDRVNLLRERFALDSAHDSLTKLRSALSAPHHSPDGMKNDPTLTTMPSTPSPQPSPPLRSGEREKMRANGPGFSGTKSNAVAESKVTQCESQPG